MSQAFRKYHILQLAQMWEERPFPLDRLMSNYFRANRAIGSKDRKAISRVLYTLFRHKGIIDAQIEPPYTWEKRVECAQNLPTLSQEEMDKLPEHVQVSFPKNLFDLIKKSYPKKVTEICTILNERAPFCIRTNTLKTDRDKLIQDLDNLHTHKGELNSEAIYISTSINIFTLPLFKEGHFEVQDEGSQYVASQIDIHPGQLVLDFCAGSGGKSLAIAPKMQRKGQLFLHDVRKRAFIEAKKRLHRAGIQNAQLIQNLDTFKQRVDVLILDVPCSGTGTLRRNPDLKWKFTEQTLSELITKQREIFAKALPFAKKGARIYYITCSLLQEENEEQIDYFTKTFPIEVKKK